MSEESGNRKARAETEEVARKSRQNEKALEEEEKSVWYGLGFFGLVGWAVAVPTVLGVMLGLWIDERVTGETSWTLVLLLAGVSLGCLNAWYWVSRESGDD